MRFRGIADRVEESRRRAGRYVFQAGETIQEVRVGEAVFAPAAVVAAGWHVAAVVDREGWRWADFCERIGCGLTEKRSPTPTQRLSRDSKEIRRDSGSADQIYLTCEADVPVWIRGPSLKQTQRVVMFVPIGTDNQ
jgi:hypothetical protein